MADPLLKELRIGCMLNLETHICQIVWFGASMSEVQRHIFAKFGDPT